MKKIILLLSFFFAQVTFSQSTTIYMIRHAEKADASANPHLSEAGKIRAEKWKSFFNDIALDFIYSTDYNRTRETAAPVAISKRKEVVLYNPAEVSLEALINKHPNKTLLIVGHSNTVPAQINALLAREEFIAMKDSEFGNLYLIEIEGKEIKTTLRIL